MVQDIFCSCFFNLFWFRSVLVSFVLFGFVLFCLELIWFGLVQFGLVLFCFVWFGWLGTVLVWSGLVQFTFPSARPSLFSATQEQFPYLAFIHLFSFLFTYLLFIYSFFYSIVFSMFRVILCTFSCDLFGLFTIINNSNSRF